MCLLWLKFAAMEWMRKAVIFISIMMITFFADQAKEAPVQIIETKKERTDPNFSKDFVNTSDFIQPQTSYHFTATVKSSQPNLVKWSDSLLIAALETHIIQSESNFTNQYLLQRKEVTLLLYPFHFFW